MSTSLLFTDVELITPGTRIERGWLLTKDSQIAALGRGDAPENIDAEVINGAGKTLLPGFIDVHVHGGAGSEAMDATPDALRTMAQFYAQHGVTSFLATTWTDSRERIQAALETIAAAVGRQPNGATIIGAHVEGPYINPDRPGAQSPVHVRRAPRDEATAFLDLGVVRLMALAPEFPENHWLIRECVKRGITVSAAHTAANYQQMQEAVALGVTQATHTGNAMTGLHHREPGTLGAVLTLPEINAEVISDNIHVHPAVVNLIYLAKGANRVILITDAVRGAGMPDGQYPLDDRIVTIRDGSVRLPDGTLAGSTLTMDRALRNFIAATGQPLANVWQASSLNAARSAGVSGRKGSLEIGKDADLVLVDANINVQMTVAEGEIVYRP
ncbi:MAG TPA: N-acetylglucosamine-6-phosphate deacetylase [Phototrophicaceae bacterium]|nr:N-acetylglucosamine-6-phosphate deacetylase [Phototrophicaceae bacterium]